MYAVCHFPSCYWPNHLFQPLQTLLGDLGYKVRVLVGRKRTSLMHHCKFLHNLLPHALYGHPLCITGIVLGWNRVCQEVMNTLILLMKSSLCRNWNGHMCNSFKTRWPIFGADNGLHLSHCR